MDGSYFRNSQIFKVQEQNVSGAFSHKWDIFITPYPHGLGSVLEEETEIVRVSGWEGPEKKHSLQDWTGPLHQELKHLWLPTKIKLVRLLAWSRKGSS